MALVSLWIPAQVRCAVAEIGARPMEGSDLKPSEERRTNTPLMGELRGMSMHMLLNLLHMEKHTCVVIAEDCKLYLEDGEVVHAECGNTEGEEAFTRVFASDPHEQTILPQKPPKRTIHKEFDSLILATIVAMDEDGELQALSFDLVDDPENHSGRDEHDNNQTTRRSFDMDLEKLSEKELLRYVVENTAGALAAGLIGMDGISLGSYNTVPDFDTTVADAEFAQMLMIGQKAAANLKIAGELDELMFVGTKAIVIVRMVGPNFYTGVALKADGNIGMARLMQKKIVPILEKRLYGKK